jgi:hypothetical protein
VAFGLGDTLLSGLGEEAAADTDAEREARSFFSRASPTTCSVSIGESGGEGSDESGVTTDTREGALADDHSLQCADEESSEEEEVCGGCAGLRCSRGGESGAPPSNDFAVGSLGVCSQTGEGAAWSSEDAVGEQEETGGLDAHAADERLLGCAVLVAAGVPRGCTFSCLCLLLALVLCRLARPFSS